MIKSAESLVAGLFFALIGAGGLWVARDYSFGTMAQPGPGLFPRILCVLLVCFGGIIMVRGLVVAETEVGSSEWRLRPLILLPGAMLAFGLTIERFGFVVAALLTLTIGAFAVPDARYKEAVVVAIVLTACTAYVFGELLGMQFSLWPRG